jgi:hypothetical protein
MRKKLIFESMPLSTVTYFTVNQIKSDSPMQMDGNAISACNVQHNARR